MTTTALKNVNSKLKNLPDALVEELEMYIDYLTFKYAQENQEIPQWHKDILDKRLQDYLKNPDDVMDFDAFCDELEKEI